MKRSLIGLLLLGLAACAGDDQGYVAGPVEGFAGIVGADEPRAALVGRDVLANGGNAADAAVAMYFTMAVTLPSRVGLAGAGACLVFDRRSKDAYLLDFMAQPGDLGGFVPRGVRAMAVLQARSGLNRWEALVGPAEAYARFGHDASRVLVRDVAVAGAEISADPVLSGIFSPPSGGVLREGDRIEQIALSATLAGIRRQGAGFFHGGPFVERYVAATGAAGLPVLGSALRGAVPLVGSPLAVEFGSETLYFPQAAGGETAAAVLWRLLEQGGYASAAAEEREALLLEAGARAFAHAAKGAPPADNVAGEGGDVLGGKGLIAVETGYGPAAAAPSLPDMAPDDGDAPPGAGFVAGDRWGNAVACAMTMNGLFGAGRTAGDTGILLAAPPEPGAQPVGFAILANTVSGEAHMAVSAAGGESSQTALARVLLDRLVGERALSESIAAPRLHRVMGTDEVYYEPGATRETIAALRARGYRLRPAVGLGLVEAFHCPEGLADSDKGCEWASDPRGTGLATVVQ